MSRTFRLPVGDLPDDGPASLDLGTPSVAVAVGAHPDDVDFACGGTLAKWAAAGCATHHVVLTDGSKGTWDPTADPGALVTTRQEEQRAAAGILGSRSVTFLPFVDGELVADLDARRALCDVLRRLRPDVVLGHDPWRRYRLHPDHRNAGWVTLDAVVAARDHGFHPDLPTGPHRVATVLLFEPDQPNHVETVDGTIDRKIEALLAHRSQHRSTMGIDDPAPTSPTRAAFVAAVHDQAAQHGRLAGVRAGEAFHRIDLD